MSTSTRQQPLQGLLARLKPFEHLHRAHQIEILAWKKEYSKYDQELRACLDTLAVPQLEPYLVWISSKDLDCFEPLAEGGFAKVYQAKAYLEPTWYPVAAKELKLSMVEELVLNVYLSRCGDNTNNAPTMDIIAVSQHFETKEYLMIMQFADIGTLEKQPCKQDGDWYTAFAYAIKLASRLASLHSMGFSHKDLHAGNVVFHTSHTVLLIDVGLSRAVEDANSESGVYGRMAYFPPEIFEGNQYTQKSDVYCLGTLLWQLIVGVPPQVNAFEAVASNPDGLREELIPGAPTTFNNIIRSCWHVNPNQRPNALEVYHQLLECAAGLVGIHFTLQPNIEDLILGGLAMTPMPFSLEMQSFIETRRITYQQKLESAKSSSSTFEFADGPSIYNSGSKFYKHSHLKKFTEEYSRSKLTTFIQQPNRGHDSIKDNIEEINQITTEHRTDDEGTDFLAELLKQKMTMHELNLSEKYTSNRATHTLIEFLKQNTNVTKLDLSKNGIGILLARALAEFLKQNSTLITLNFRENSMGAEGACSLAESLKQNTTLTELNLGANNIGDEGACSIAESLKQNTTLTKLNLFHNGIGDEGAHSIAESLKQNTTLTKVNLEGNSIRGKGACAIAESLKQNTTLTELNLEGNNIGNEGARALAESLQQNTTLTELNLEDNSIDSEGACAIAECLKQNVTLTKLNLLNNSIGDKGACALAESLKQNTTLAKLNLFLNVIGEKGACAFVESLEQNTTLTELNLGENNFNRKVISMLESLKSSRLSW